MATTSRKAGSGRAAPEAQKKAPTSISRRYRPRWISSPVRRGLSQRPSLLVRAPRSNAPARSRRTSTPAAGLPLARSSTWVVRPLKLVFPRKLSSACGLKPTRIVPRAQDCKRSFQARDAMTKALLRTDDGRTGLPPRPDRLRRKSSACGLAGRRARGGAVRAELRGGRRTLGAARRRRGRDLPVRYDQSGACARRAPHVHGVDLRVRLARRGVAAAAPVRAARDPADHLWRGHGPGAASVCGRGVPAGRPRDRLARPALDQLPVRTGGRGARAHGPRRRDYHAADRRTAARLVHRADLAEHAPFGG